MSLTFPLTPYLIHLVNVVKERPLEHKENLASCLGQKKIIKLKLSIFYCMIFSLYHIEWKSNDLGKDGLISEGIFTLVSSSEKCAKSLPANFDF